MTPVIWKFSLKGSFSELPRFCSVAVSVRTVRMQGLIYSAEKLENYFTVDLLLIFQEKKNSKTTKVSTH